MIFKKLDIENFRSYYGLCSFEFSDKLNLIIGSNGDGKTTFFDALEWLFRTDNTNKMDIKFISKKRCEELSTDQCDNVRVALTYEHFGRKKILEKTFNFTKSFDGKISTSNYSFLLYEDNGVERTPASGINFDHDLPVEQRKFTMFKGEADLDVLERSNSLKYLVDTFSDVKNFESYFKFMEFASLRAKTARDNAQKKDNKNKKEIKDNNRIVEYETGILNEIEREIQNKENEEGNFEKLLKSIEQSQESAKFLVDINNRIKKLQEERLATQGRIKEDYTISLLDQMWILMNFESVADEYSEKIFSLTEERKKLERQYMLAAGAERYAKKVEKDIEHGLNPLPAHVPGPKIMQSMIDKEICWFCGRKAEKHTDAWNYMMQRLQEYKDSLKVDDKESEIPPMYENNFIEEIQKLDTSLTDNLSSITKLLHKIKEQILFNERLRKDVRKIDANLEKAFEQKKRILAQSDGLSEEQLTANYQNVSTWMDKKHKASDRIEYLKGQRAKHRAILEEAQKNLSKMAEGTMAEMFAKIYTIISQISQSFENAKERNKRNLLFEIEDQSNKFLEKLNTDDFKGTIHIIEQSNSQGEVFLKNIDGNIISNPNTALRTTYLMSVLFGIGAVSQNRKETDYPLIFDAPTSSFTDTKEAEFFRVISKLDKQVIIVTKSFLRDMGNGKQTLDVTRIKDIDSSIYRIEKKRPFNDKDLATIQTLISKIK